MFKIDDVVEITEESNASGMLDFKDGKGYKVESVRYYEYNSTGRPYRENEDIRLTDESGVSEWYAVSHFKLKVEEAMEDTVKFKIGDTLVCTETNPVELSANFITTGEEYVVTGLWELGVRIADDDGEERGVCDYRFKLKGGTIVEKRECLFKEGQVVWDVVYGKGRVVEIAEYSIYPVVVQFSDETMAYSEDGKTYETHGRTLFFSEPKIEAATEPVFEPTLKKGDVVIISRFKGWTIRENFKIGVVEEETEEFVYTTGDDPWDKYARDFYRLGEKINFK